MRPHRRRALVVFATVLTVLVFAGLATMRGQTAFGTVQGVVKDDSGAALPGVEVTLNALFTASRRSTVTGAKGEFEFTRVEPGRYEIIAALAGFTTKTANATIRAGGTVNLSIAMGIGQLAETVTVVAASPVARAQNLQVLGYTGGIVAGAGGGNAIGIANPDFNTEAYDRIDDNQWFEVARKPLSTFSADVDTASYANVRRFLREGLAPPKDAVRIEELINYFQFDYPQPRDDKPFSVTTSIGDCPWKPSHRLALVGLQARKIDSAKIPPRNLVFLIDVSGSMYAPNKLPLVKASLAMLAPNLTERDRVAIVVYAGNSGLVLPSTPGSDTTTILAALHQLEAGGSTNGGAGLRLAYKVAQDHFINGGVNRVILATDGDFNVGVTDQGSLLRLIEEKRESGVALSVLGYGMGNLKDSTMVKLADAGNGNYAYIDSLAEANKVLVEQAGGTLVTVAKDVKLQVEFNPRLVAAYRLIGYEKRVLQDQDFNNDRKDAGEIGAGHSVTALYELVPAGQPIDVPSIDPLKYQQTAGRGSSAALSPAARSDEAMTVKIRYKQPDGQTSSLMEIPVSNRMSRDPALGFAAAVAEFGMLLQDSEHKGSASYAQAAELAKEFKGEDPHGHRAEFIRLIGVAEGVSRTRPTADQQSRR